LADIIGSGVVPAVRLTKVFRQAAASRIITNAHRINQGLMPDLSAGAGREQAVRIAWRREEQLEISQRPRWPSVPIPSAPPGSRRERRSVPSSRSSSKF
jgi:hypothetical protein